MGAEGDRPRYIGRTHGYVDFAGVAADQIEAVTEREQAELTRRAHARWARERRRRWGEAAKEIDSAVSDFASGGVDRRLASDLRVIRRSAERVAQRLDEEVRRADGGD